MRMDRTKLNGVPKEAIVSDIIGKKKGKERIKN